MVVLKGGSIRRVRKDGRLGDGGGEWKREEWGEGGKRVREERSGGEG